MENFRKEETKETQASERASAPAKLPANRIKFQRLRCGKRQRSGTPEIAGYSKAGPKEI